MRARHQSEWTLLDSVAPNGTLIARVLASGSAEGLFDHAFELPDLPALQRQGSDATRPPQRVPGRAPRYP